jgi:PIN domain nuclease of toxin-antitoxin system
MRYLLDTHVVLWWLTEPERLSEQAQTIIADKTNSISVSSVSFWELAIKSSLGRVTIPRNLLSILNHNNFDILPIIAEEALSLVDLPNLHKDPLDRMLIAQAKYNGLIFITRDEAIQNYPITLIKA